MCKDSLIMWFNLIVWKPDINETTGLAVILACLPFLECYVCEINEWQSLYIYFSAI